MKILITHERFPPSFYGGGERVVYELAKRLKLKGHDIAVLTTGNPKIKEFDGIPTTRMPMHRYLMNLAVPWIYKHAKDVDLIQTNNYNACLPSLIAGKLLGKPVVSLVHALWADKWLEMRGFLAGNISRLVEQIQLSRSYNKIIFFSNFARDEGLKLGILKELTEVIPLGIDYGKYQARTKENFVLFVGRLAKQKGIDYPIQAANELPDIKFEVAGTGEEEKRIKSCLPENVELLGFVPHEQLVDLYARAPILCLPSVAETFGLVILEAMASGCAIVSTVPLDYEGVKINYGNTEQLKEALRFLYDNREVSLKMGRVNREKAKDYTWDNFIEKLIHVYEEVIISHAHKKATRRECQGR